MNKNEFSNYSCVTVLKQKYGYSDSDLLNLLDIPKDALKSDKLTEKALKNLNLLQAILTKEGIL